MWRTGAASNAATDKPQGVATERNEMERGREDWRCCRDNEGERVKGAREPKGRLRGMKRAVLVRARGYCMRALIIPALIIHHSSHPPSTVDPELMMSAVRYIHTWQQDVDHQWTANNHRSPNNRNKPSTTSWRRKRVSEWKERESVLAGPRGYMGPGLSSPPRNTTEGNRRRATLDCWTIVLRGRCAWGPALCSFVWPD